MNPRKIIIQVVSIGAIALQARPGGSDDRSTQCSWGGRWDAVSGDPVASSPILYHWTFDINHGRNGITGTYNWISNLPGGGTLSGEYVDQSHRTVVGKWIRTQGGSGGHCNHGTFKFQLVADRRTGACKIKGSWNYCNNPPRWFWNATKK